MSITGWVQTHFTDRSGIGRAKRNQQRARAQYREAMRETRAKGLRDDDLARAGFDAYTDAQFAEDDYDALNTDILESQARQRNIQVPRREEDSEYWRRSSITNEFFLSDEGTSTLASAIDAHRRTKWTFRIQLISILIGLIGAISALLAVILTLISSFGPRSLSDDS